MKTKSILFTFFLALVMASAGLAQNNVKIGYTNPEYILSMMPKYKQAESELQSYQKQLQAQLDSKLKEYQVKLETYQKDLNILTDVVKQDKEKELIAMQTSIKEFEENARGSIEKKELSILDPLFQEIQKAIDAVAQENGFTYIFSSSAGNGQVILYSKYKDEDISDLVLKKLGITPPTPKSETGSTNTNTNTNTTVTPKPNTTSTGTGTAPLKKKTN